MLRVPARVLTLLIALVIAITALATPAMARETRPIADRFTVEIGFVNEPAIQADTNGLWLRVVEGEEPVTGLEQSLQAEVIYGDAVRALPVIPSIDEPGVYTSTFIPVQPGNYTFRISGTIADVAIDESFTSGPEGVAPVDARIDYEFPTAAQGWITRDLAMPAALGMLVVAWGALGYVSRRGKS
jgi:hypothetical protein